MVFQVIFILFIYFIFLSLIFILLFYYKDLHPGKGFPIGSANASELIIYPHLVGNDIGCGMSLFKTSLKTKKIKLDKWFQSLNGLECGWEGDYENFLKNRNISPTEFDKNSLGTIGGGNHFAELQQVKIKNKFFSFYFYLLFSF